MGEEVPLEIDVVIPILDRGGHCGVRAVLCRGLVRRVCTRATPRGGVLSHTVYMQVSLSMQGRHVVRPRLVQVQVRGGVVETINLMAGVPSFFLLSTSARRTGRACSCSCLYRSSVGLRACFTSSRNDTSLFCFRTTARSKKRTQSRFRFMRIAKISAGCSRLVSSRSSFEWGAVPLTRTRARTRARTRTRTRMHNITAYERRA